MMASTQVVELGLTSEAQRGELLGSIEANNSLSLPPTDGGKDAWLFLLACFMLEGLVWGFPLCFGVFQEYYSTHEPFAASKGIAVVSACAMGLMYLDLILIFTLLKRFPKLRLWSTPVGLVTAGLALGLGSLSNNVGHLIVTQGVLYAIGGGFAWTPVLFFVEEWWVSRRGFAYGAIMAGQGLAGAILPGVLEWLLRSHGFRTTLRVCALSFVVLTFPVLFFFKPRLPFSQAVQPRGFDMSFLTSRYFLILLSANMIQGIGYFLPATFLPTFARSFGASEFESIGTVILLNGAAFMGCICMGVAVDSYHVTTCLLVAAIASTLAVFLLWGFSTSLAPLYIFSLVYGAFAGCNSSSWSAIMRETKEKKPRADSGMIFASLSAGKGVANLCSGPLSEALLQVGTWKADMAYGTTYGSIIVFTGTMSLFGGWGYAAKRMGWL